MLPALPVTSVSRRRELQKAPGGQKEGLRKGTKWREARGRAEKTGREPGKQRKGNSTGVGQWPPL